VAVRIAGGEEVAAAKLFRREADDFGDLVHVAFQREEACGCAEAAKGSVGRDVGGHRLGADGEVRPVVGAGRVDGGAGEDDGRERDVGAAVDDDLDLAGEEFAVAETAVRWRVRLGWRLVVAMRSSARS
jgi:hypothetical protein